MSKFRTALLTCVAVAVTALAGLPALAQTPKTTATPADSVTIPIQHYLVDLSYDATSGQAKVISTTLVNGAANTGVEPTGGWRYDVVTGQGEVIDHRFITVPMDCQSANAANPKAKAVCSEKKQFDLALEIPYDSTAANINVYDSARKLVAFVDVSSFADTCGNGVCDANENFSTCPRDCRSGIKDGNCDKVADGVCDPDCAAGQDKDCSQSATVTQGNGKTGTPIFPIVVVLIIIVIIAAVIVGALIKKRKGQAPTQGEAEQKPVDNPSQDIK